MADEARFDPLPVYGYTQQAGGKVALVNQHKVDEEVILRHLDSLVPRAAYPNAKSEVPDGFLNRRWLDIARTHFEQGFMALNRAVFNPQRVGLPSDNEDDGA